MIVLQGGTLYHGGTFVRDDAACRWCGKGHHNRGTMECDGCWELRHRIEDRPKLARRMLDEIGGAR